MFINIDFEMKKKINNTCQERGKCSSSLLNAYIQVSQLQQSLQFNAMKKNANISETKMNCLC